jgi:2-polyprenyl-6-methoxyphenol hydroxylase-like FAD-dependent oxidoreductase
MSCKDKKIIVVGGGIGGLAAAVALSQQGVHVTVLEQAAELGEIGAGVQLGPNAFAALDALGVGEKARKRAVFTERLIMMDAVDGSEVGSFPVGQAFRDRFQNPYAVIHRADIHATILEGAQGSDLIQVETSTKVVSVSKTMLA